MESFGLHAGMIWLLIALVLGGIEILTLSFFLLWPALAALILALVTWIFPDIAWGWQIVIFAVLSVLLLIPGRRWVKKSMIVKNEKIVNDRGEMMVGKLGYIVSGKDGIYRAKLGDTQWSARGARDLTKGEQIRVTSVDGITLNVEKA